MNAKKTSWTVKELDNFKKMILEKKSKTKKDMDENQKKSR